MKTKICTSCNKEQLLICFNKHSRYKDGLHNWCKNCWKIYRLKYNLDNKLEIAASNKKRDTEFHLKNPEKAAQNSKKWRESNPQKVIDYAEKYLLLNKEKIAARHRKYRAENPEKGRNATNIRRARKHANGIYQISSKELKTLYASPCIYCGSTDSIQADHVIPIAKGGRHSIGNLVPACTKCNQSKGSKLLSEWILAFK